MARSLDGEVATDQHSTSRKKSANVQGIDMPYLQNDGVDIYYEASGTGAPLLMINGYGPPCTWVSRFYMPHFVDRFHCATYDLRGVGKSGEPTQAIEYDTDRLAKDGLAVMDAMGWPTAHVWGASLGAMIAVALAWLAPKRVRSLVLNSVDTGAPNLQQKKYAKLVKGRIEYFRLAYLHRTDPMKVAMESAKYYYAPERMHEFKDTIAWYAENVAKNGIKRPWPPFSEVLQQITDVDAYVADLPETAEPQPGKWLTLYDKVHDIKTKALLLQGYEDGLIGVDSALYAFEKLDNAEVRIYKNMKHSFSSRPDVLRQEADWIWARQKEHAPA